MVSMPGGKETNVHHNHLKPVKIRESEYQVDHPVTQDKQKQRKEERKCRETNITNEDGSPLPSFMLIPSKKATEEQPAQPDTAYFTRSGRVSRIPVKYPDPE